MPILIDELRKIILVRFMCSFGKSEYPFAYNIISKCLRYLISIVIKNSVVFIYVDDCFLFSFVDSAQENLKAALKVHTDFLGLDAMNDEKSSKVPTIDGIAIGWYINFETATISPCAKAIDKLTLTLFEILDIEASHWELQQVQCIVSLVIRYSVALLGMSCFCQPFIDMLRQQGSEDPAALRLVSEEARFALLIWRAAVLNNNGLAVPMSVFEEKSDTSCDYLTINDASNYLGAGIYKMIDKEPKLIAFTSFRLPFLLIA